MNTTYLALGGGAIVLFIILGSKKGGSSAGIYGADPAAINAGVAVYNAQLNATTHLDDNRTSVSLAGIKSNSDQYAISQSTSLGKYTLDIANQMNTTNAGRDVTLGGYALSASNHVADTQAASQQAATAAQLSATQSTNGVAAQNGFLGFLGGLVGPILGIFGL